MTEETTPTNDTAKIEADLLKEKLDAQAEQNTTLEAELAKYKAAEAERLKTEEEKALEAKFDDKLKAKEEELEKSFEAKFEKLIQRQSTNGTSANGNSTIPTFEEYKNMSTQEREKYDTAALKAALPSIF